MTQIHNAIHIKAPAERTFTALTDTAELARWHLGHVEGAVAPGETFRVESGKLRFGWRAETVEPGRIVQTLVEGPDATAGRTLTITVKPVEGGRTRVDFVDDGWDASHPHLPLCNTYWGEALVNLRNHLEAKG